MPSRGLKKREKRPNENHYVIESGQAMDGKDSHMLERMDVCMHVINNLPLSIWSKKNVVCYFAHNKFRTRKLYLTIDDGVGFHRN
jgi:hypothetical protein